MFKVECPGCQAPYQVDERRVPPTGLKMRCPKCGSSFQVEAPPDARQTAPTPLLSEAGVPEPSDARAKAPRPPRPPTPAPRPRAERGTIAGMAPPPRDVATAPARPQLQSDPYGELDLPSVSDAGSGAARSRFELDEPMPSSSPPALSELELSLDLPSVPPPAARPNVTRPASDFGELDLDLPSPAAARRAGPEVALPDSTLDLDLPLPRGSSRELDLPGVAAPKPADARVPAHGPPRAPAGRSPAPGAPRPPQPAAERAGPVGRLSQEDQGHLDLPAPGGAARSNAVDVPSAVGEAPPSIAGLPALTGLGLPAASGGNLPAPSGGNLPLPTSGNLPAPSGGDLPTLSGAGLPSAHAQLPTPLAELPSVPPPAEPFGELDLPPLNASQPPRAASDRPLALSQPPYGSSQPPLGVSYPPPAGAPPSVVREAGGGVHFGEVNLASEPATLGLDAEPPPRAPRGEFGAGGAPPSLAATSGLAAVAAPTTAYAPEPRAETPPTTPKKKRSGRALRTAAVIVAVVAVGGGALALVPNLGPFGAYWITDQLKQDEYQELTRSTVRQARAKLQLDTYPAARAALGIVDSAQRGAPRVPALAAYAAFVAYLSDLRFGVEPAARARAQVALDGLAGLPDEHSRELRLARAAAAASKGQLAKARQLVDGELRAEPRDPDALVLSAEVDLKAREAERALSHWRRAAEIEPGARTAFGLARSEWAREDFAAAAPHLEATLRANPEHVGSKILAAELAWERQYDEKKALGLLDAVTSRPELASPRELVLAYTLMGNVHLGRSRVSLAENAYGQALKLEPKAAGALKGLGEALFRAGRYSEALARFEAAAEADADAVAAKVGVAKTSLALERVQDAADITKRLREQNPKSVLVNYWYGQVQEALGQRQEAEAAYRAAIASGESHPALVDAYVALAVLLGQLGKSDEAQAALTEAKAKLADTPAVHQALGELALAQGRVPSAIAEFKAALALDQENVAAKFRLGVALRRNRQFEEAAKMLDEVAAVDREHPGLALERGLLHEQSGNTEEALKSYEAALAKAPNDLDLLLRVGCGKVMAGRPEQALDQLRKVLAQRPNSAESNHCLGRALLLQGTNLGEALRFLERSVELDPHRAEYHLYVGWAANEAGRVSRAEDALARALTLDKGLGDAYWQRGVLRHRQGAVKDAAEDLRRAIELNPGRIEAHASLADSLYDLGREQEAIAEWQQAVQAQPDNATWRFRYGKLLAINHRAADASEQLGRALELAAKEEVAPRWTWEAHHLLARSLGNDKDAIPHWEEFLRQGPRESPYRAEAKAALEKLGKPWHGE